MPKGIIVFGLNGSGKSTLVKALGKALKIKAMDIEDYHFMPADVPLTKARSLEDRQALMMADIRAHGNFVLAAITGDLGLDIEETYVLGILLKAPQAIRMSRVQERDLEKYGDRVRPGGDMYLANQAFVNRIGARSHESVDLWMARLKCPVIEVDGTQALETIIEDIVAYINSRPGLLA